MTNFRIPKELGPPLTPLAGPLSALSPSSGDLDLDLPQIKGDLLEPPHPRFAAVGAGAGLKKPVVSKKPRPHSLALSDASDASDVSVDSIVDMYYLGLENTNGEGSGSSDFGLEGGRGRDRGRRDADASDGYGGGSAEGEGDELGHETHVLDYTNFDGDDDTPLPGENRLSRKLIKEGKLRRAKSRRTTKALEAKEALEKKAQRGKSPPPPDEREQERSDRYSRRASSMLSTEPLLASAHASGLSPIGSPPSSFALTHTPASSSASTLPGGAGSSGGNVRWAENVNDPRERERESLITLNNDNNVGGNSSRVGGLVLDAQEARDLQAVAEWARPGKPKLARILADEVEAAAGRVAVACESRFRHFFSFLLVF